MNPNIAFTAIERRSIFSVAILFLARMFGLFSVFPVLGLYAKNYSDYSPTKVGLALGIFGLTQMFLFIPMGIWADRSSKLKVIYFCLLLFFFGSIICALAQSLTEVIVGRALQGSGAMAGVLMSLVNEAVHRDKKGKAMMIVGATIGFSFLLAFAISPVLAESHGMSSIFWLNAGLAIFSIMWLAVSFPKIALPQVTAKHLTGSEILQQFRQHIIGDRELMSINISIFLAHNALMALFVILPSLLSEKLQIHSIQLSLVLVGVTFGGAVLVLRQIMQKNHSTKNLRTIICFAPVGLGLIALSLGDSGLFYNAALIIGLLFFMAYFCYIESAGPALTSNLAQGNIKASTMSTYTSFQFGGVFTGGVLGGLMLQYSTSLNLVLGLCLLFLLWILISLQLNRTAK